MISNDHNPLKTIVANAGRPPYPIPKGKTTKLDKIDLRSDEFLYLLATFCFDAHRKLLYLCQATVPIHGEADPAFIRQAQRDSDEIQNEKDWEGRAKKAEQIMLRLQKDLEKDIMASPR